MGRNAVPTLSETCPGLVSFCVQSWKGLLAKEVPNLY